MAKATYLYQKLSKLLHTKYLESKISEAKSGSNLRHEGLFKEFLLRFKISTMLMPSIFGVLIPDCYSVVK